MKRIIISLLCCVILFGNTVMAHTSGEKLQDLGIISGDSDGNLLEDEPLTRAQLAVIVCQLNKVSEEAKGYTVNQGFDDVSDNSWYAPYVNYAKNKGWLNGTSATTFNPDGVVTEEMVAIVLERILGYDPTWGQATEYAENLGIYVEVQKADTILRREVFEYMYQTLFQTPKGSESMLYESLGLDIHEAYMHLKGLRMDEDYNFDYVDVYGKAIQTDFQKSLEENGDTSYYTSYSEDASKELTFLSDDEYVIQEEDGRLVKQLKWSELGDASKDYQLTAIRPEYIILSEYVDGYIVNDYVYDWSGSLIELPMDEPNHFCEASDDGYVVVQMLPTDYREVTDIYLYDTQTKRIVEDVYPYELGSKIGEDLWLFSKYGSDYDNQYEIRNLKTKEKNAFSFADRSSDYTYYLEWNYGMNRGVVYKYNQDEEGTFSDTLLIDLKGKIVAESPYYVYDYAFDNGSLYIVLDEANNSGLMNTDGKVILETEYSDIYQVHEDYLKVTDTDGNVFYLTKDLTRLSEEDYIDKTTVKTVLPNGYTLYIGEQYVSSSRLVDENGTIVLSFESYDEVSYIPSLHTIVSLYELYNIDGEIIEMGADAMYYSFDGDFIIQLLEDKTSIIDNKGHTIIGPYEGRISFN